MAVGEPSIRGLRLLAEVARGDGLVRSACQLGMSQSGASHTLAVLAETLGATLTTRETRRGLRLSETGVRILPHVQRILASVEALRHEIAGLTELREGHLRIAAVPSVGSTLLPRLIREFHSRFPAIEISLFEGTDGEVGEWCASGAADIGFATLPQPGLLQQVMTRDEWMAVVPAAARPITVGGVELESLHWHPFLLSGGGCEDHIRQLFRDAGLGLPLHREVKQVNTVLAMVAEGLGVTIVPRLSIHNSPPGVRASRLRPRRFRTIGFLLRNDGPHAPTLRAWMALIQSHFPIGREQGVHAETGDAQATRSPVRTTNRTTLTSR